LACTGHDIPAGAEIAIIADDRRRLVTVRLFSSVIDADPKRASSRTAEVGAACLHASVVFDTIEAVLAVYAILAISAGDGDSLCDQLSRGYGADHASDEPEPADLAFHGDSTPFAMLGDTR
jgi:hypothetical protein